MPKTKEEIIKKIQATVFYYNVDELCYRIQFYVKGAHYDTATNKYIYPDPVEVCSMTDQVPYIGY